MDRPNVLFFFVDQQRWDTCGCYGNPLGITPNLDAMAGEGVLYENAITCQPVCGPARACLQTGKWATQVGAYRNDKMLPPDEPTIAHRFGGAGYQVAYIGKWHLASDRDAGVDNRFGPVPEHLHGGWKDYWLASDVLEGTSHAYDGHMYGADGRAREFPAGRFRADAQTDWVIEYLREKRRPDEPFFLFVSYIEPHHQNDRGRYEGPAGSRERFRDFPVPGDLEGTAGDWREQYPDYLGCIHSLDANLGRVREALRELGLEENTLVVYASDHGSHFRTRNAEYKRSCHDGCVRIPLVIRGPGYMGGRRVAAPVSLLDLPPTFLASAGIPVPAEFGGVPLSRSDRPGDVFIQISESQVGRALRTSRWKYSVSAPHRDGWKDMDSDRYVEEFLYDLEADPHERTNLVADPAHADIRAALRTRLVERMAAAGEAPPEIVPAAP